MQVITRIAELRERLGQNGSQGKPTSATHAQQTVAFVPTMGNLHAGHISLIQQARPLATTVVASIFVNRLQFAPNEDFDRYPRTFDADCEGLKAAGADVLFFPEERELYPEPQGFVVQPPAIGQMLEERFRPGFFRGVSTVVLKLFNLVQPQIAIFGKKDYQQLRVIEALVRQLALPIQIIAAETGRDHDGLALSSRNGYLSPAERAEAPRLYQTLQAMQQRIRGGERNFLALENDAIELLRSQGWRPDYISLRHRQTLQPASADASEGVIVAAARLGTTRLIDNIEV